MTREELIKDIKKLLMGKNTKCLNKEWGKMYKWGLICNRLDKPIFKSKDGKEIEYEKIRNCLIKAKEKYEKRIEQVMQQIRKKLIIDIEYKSIFIRNLDFGKFTIDLSKMKAKDIYNNGQVAELIDNKGQNAEIIDNEDQKGEYIYNTEQKTKGNKNANSRNRK